MIRGMTGQASLRFSTDTFDVEMEIRSVNSRYFEFRLKCPSRYYALEIGARKLISKKLARGKVDLSLRINEKEVLSKSSLINKPLAKAYLEESQKLAQELNISDIITMRELLSLPQVLNVDMSDVDESVLKLFLDKLDVLIDQMLPMMMTEGESTVNDVNASLTTMENSLSFIKKQYPQVLEKYKENLKERVREVTQTKTPEERLSVEVELFASRTAINEEVVRLDNHIRVMKDILVGKRKDGSKELDFIGQEMNREVNTIASKSSDFEITEQTIILKSEVEKMREQFRNIV